MADTLDEASAPRGVKVPASARGDVFRFGGGAKGFLRASFSFLAVLVLLLIGLEFVFGIYKPEMNDPDIWWHLRNAQTLLQEHHFPRTDTYSFTVAGHPWMNHEWLSEVPYYFAYLAFGLNGLKTLSFAVWTAIFLLLLAICFKESRNFKASVVACCYALFLATVSFGPRTILFGYLYLVILLAILRRFRRGETKLLWFLPVLFCLWINTHGSWSIGLILFFLIGVSGLIEGSWGRVDAVRWAPKQLRQLIMVASASVAALFANPFGWRLVYYPFDMAFKQKLNIAHVLEWVSVDFHDLRGKLVMLLIVGLILSALLRSRRWNLGELLVLLFALYSGLTYVRFLVLLGIVAAPILAKGLDFFPLYRPKDEVYAVNVVVIAAAISAMLYFWPRDTRIRTSINETYPAAVLPYLQQHPPQGNVLNLYLWGGYIEWHAPAVKMFIDSRVDIFEYAGVLKDYLDLLGADTQQHRPDALLDKYHIRYVLFPPSTSQNPLHMGGSLAYALENDPHWKTIYRDNVCVLLEKQ